MVRLLRPANVLIVGITEMLFWFFLVQPTLLQGGSIPILNNTTFTLLMIMTMCLTAAGYVINDMLDIPTDSINKPDHPLVTGKVSYKQAQAMYLMLNALAIVLASYLFYVTKSFNVLAICGFCILILWLYSRYLKSTILIGNVVVSFFIAGIPFLLLIIESAAFQELRQGHPNLYLSSISVIIAFTIFAFLSNLIREIVKDCEDRFGDARAGIMTIATALGPKRADLFSQSLTIVLTLFAVIWFGIKKLWHQTAESIIYFFLVIAPLIYLFYLLTLDREKADKYSKISRHIKLLMVFGLSYLLVHLNYSYA